MHHVWVLKPYLEMLQALLPDDYVCVQLCERSVTCMQARYSAARALAHPWIAQDGIAPDAPLDVRVIQNMSRFASYNRVKKAILVEIAKTFKESEISDLRRQFAVMDTDNSGTISIDEMFKAMTSFKTGENGKPVFSEEEIKGVRCPSVHVPVSRGVSLIRFLCLHSACPCSVHARLAAPPPVVLGQMAMFLRPVFHCCDLTGCPEILGQVRPSPSLRLPTLACFPQYGCCPAPRAPADRQVSGSNPVGFHPTLVFTRSNQNRAYPSPGRPPQGGHRLVVGKITP